MKMWALIPMLAVLSFAARAADNLEQIEAAMKKSWDGLKSVSMDSEMVMEQSTPQFSFKNASTGTTEMLKDGAKWKMRSETKGTMVQKFGDQETKTASNTLMVSDGEYIYSLTDSNGMKQAFKMKVQPGQEYAGDSWVKSMREIYDLKVLPEEAVDGANCWVLEATPKQAGGAQGVSIFYFTKDSGMMVKSIGKGPDGKVLSTMTSKNIKINPSIAADRFVFTAPPGVTVIDQSAALQAAQQQQAAQAEPAKEEPAKAETAKTEEPAKKEETAAKKEEPKKEEKKKKKIGIGGF
jgi:outer membrane lipoprotein-sorting protein